MNKEIKAVKTSTLPVLPLRGLPVFPYMIIHFDVGRNKSINAVEECMIEDQLLFLLAQKDPEAETITPDDLFRVGTIARVKQILRVSDDDVRVLVEGVSRARVEEFTSTSPYFECRVTEYAEYGEKSEEKRITEDAYVREITNSCVTYFSLLGKIDTETAPPPFINVTDAEQFSDLVAAALAVDIDVKQELLEEFDVIKRLEKIMSILHSEIEILKLEKMINHKVKDKIDKNQREYYLREQIKVIRDELGEEDDIEDEKDEILKKLEETNAPDYVLEKAQKEIARLEHMQPSSPDASVIRNYLEWLCAVPWNVKDEENKNLNQAAEILDEDHYGMKKVKERIVEFLAVRTLSGGKKSPIICLVGPPGVGKTSVAKSIARALNRKYVRMSLGGVKDEAEIRGHRKTYIGAMPGRIISALKQAGTSNPLILLDEIDKLGADHRGSTSAALLEVLDSEQNCNFRDHYIELETDLSDVLFLTTANSLETIDSPLLDRMEVIELSGYTDREKLAIAKEYIIPKQIMEHGLKKSNVKISDEAILETINSYTRESGVRELERKISEIMRKIARAVVADGKKSVSVSGKTIEKFLGNKIFRDLENTKKDEVGVATGLAWTMYGGDTLSIEVNLMEGSGNIELTGQLGDVMKESAKAAISYIRANCKKFGIKPDFHKQYDIHIHVPEGAVPKDGPSAGITMATALISALTGKKISKKVAMTGEITITGKILPIGGLKEKSLAAYRMGVKTVLVPEANVKDIEEIPEEVRTKLNFVVADTMDTVLKTALV
ncbi:MAG: endopeptidase La [Clostridia bacterium]|nr:endopeptidase La [Clostridia bacterium]